LARVGAPARTDAAMNAESAVRLEDLALNAIV
jgi:hypothetical protein